MTLRKMPRRINFRSIMFLSTPMQKIDLDSYKVVHHVGRGHGDQCHWWIDTLRGVAVLKLLKLGGRWWLRGQYLYVYW